MSNHPGLMPENPEQTEIDKVVCKWLHDKRNGKMTKDKIKQLINSMSSENAEMYKNALRNYGSKFI